MGLTITIYSTRGGSGKTITSLSVGKTLASRGFKTAVVDVDIGAPSIIHLLPPELKEIKYWPNYLENEEVTIDEILSPGGMENLSIIYSSTPEMGKHNLQTKHRIWWENALRRSLQAQQELYDMGFEYLIFDNQSGISMNSVNNMILADKSVLIVRPANYGADATESFIGEMYRILKGIKPRKDYYVWNQVILPENEEERQVVDNFLDHYNRRIAASGLELAAVIPFDRYLSLRLLSDRRDVLYDLPSTVQKPIDTLVDKLCEEED